MGFFGNLVDGLRVKNNEIEDDDYFLDDEYYDDEDDGYDDYEEEAPRGNIFNKFSGGRKSAAEEQSPKTGIFTRKVVPMQQSNMEVTMKRPKDVNDSTAICDELLDGKAVVINLEGVDGSIAQRIIDFTLGSIYSVNGDLQQISTFIFIASPHSIELSGDFKGDFSKSYMKADSQRAVGSNFSY
ncbi:MAG: cell division protein SepF [Eubacteriales bacterium]|nr:cell division protein SepF [Eubacteriales bacterium]